MDTSPAKEELSSRIKSLKHEMDSSPQAREKKTSRQRSYSSSPRTKRLRRAQAERETKTVVETDHESNHGKGDGRHRERETESFSEREHEKILAKRRGGQEEMHGKSSRARNGRSTSPFDRPNKDVHGRECDQLKRNRMTVSASSPFSFFSLNFHLSVGNIILVNDDDDSVAKMKAAEEALESKHEQQSSFELSGKLAAETNRVLTVLFNEPPDARKPDIRWRLYVFKNGEVLNEPLYIHRQTCYLFGKERRVADIPTDHPSYSKQHAVIQFRQVEKEQHDGTLPKQVRIIPLYLNVIMSFLKKTRLNLVTLAEHMSYCTGIQQTDGYQIHHQDVFLSSGFLILRCPFEAEVTHCGGSLGSGVLTFFYSSRNSWCHNNNFRLFWCWLRVRRCFFKRPDLHSGSRTQ
ncbi:hypothetical protein MANES_15G074502v8 [Manihot esculenta]|uniref:Uncharacterized protein n=1 Tax=Manihot esculenta TaxID=3983 RepID=A0ACB7GBD8_MANES|nr:hypothetical protein MANES_15G074502v8 [Manihot esculenta]